MMEAIDRGASLYVADPSMGSKIVAMYGFDVGLLVRQSAGLTAVCAIVFLQEGTVSPPQ